MLFIEKCNVHGQIVLPILYLPCICHGNEERDVVLHPNPKDIHPARNPISVLPFLSKDKIPSYYLSDRVVIIKTLIIIA